MLLLRPHALGPGVLGVQVRFHQHVLSVFPWTSHLASRCSVNFTLNHTFRVLSHYMHAEYLILTKLLIFDTPIMQLKIKRNLKVVFSAVIILKMSILFYYFVLTT